MLLRTAALSDIGRIRRQNEDRFILEDDLHLYGVADGVGGLPGGADAAQTAVQKVVELFRKNPANLVELTQEANRTVAQLGMRLSPRHGIGSTLTFGHFTPENLRLVHVGDSRCYLVRKGEISCLTRDHSVENELKARGNLFELANLSEHNRNALTRCIGQYTPLQVDLIEHRLAVGDRYLFCSDGVTKMLRETEIQRFLDDHADPKKIVAEMIDRANQRGGLDNATAVIVMIDPLP